MNDYVSLLVHAGSGPEAEGRIALAAALAARFDASLIGMVAAEALLPAFGVEMPATAITEVLEAEEADIKARAEAARICFTAAAGAVARGTTWRETIDFPAAALARESRDADLLIIGRRPEPESWGIANAVAPGDVLMQAGRPVLVVPPGIRQLAARHIVLAWKDTQEARRAMSDALPFLQRAEGVLVVEIVEEPEERVAAAIQLDRVAAYLERHGVKARAEVRLLGEANVPEELQLLAERETADLIVAGGYGHARLREWIFGGVTQGLLRRCPKCCLLSH